MDYFWEIAKFIGLLLLTLFLLAGTIVYLVGTFKGEGFGGKLGNFLLFLGVGSVFLGALAGMVQQGKWAFMVFHQEGRDELSARYAVEKMVAADISPDKPLLRHLWPARLKALGLETPKASHLDYADALIKVRVNEALAKLVKERVEALKKEALKKEALTKQEMESLLASLDGPMREMAARLADEKYRYQDLDLVLRAQLSNQLKDKKIQVAAEGWGNKAPWETVAQGLQAKMGKRLQELVSGSGWGDPASLQPQLEEAIAALGQEAMEANPDYAEQIPGVVKQQQEKAGQEVAQIISRLEALDKAARSSQLLQAAGAPESKPTGSRVSRERAEQELAGVQALRGQVAQLLAIYPGLKNHPRVAEIEKVLAAQRFQRLEADLLYATKVTWPLEGLFGLGGSPFKRFALYFLALSVVLYLAARFSQKGPLCMLLGLLALPVTSLPLWYATTTYLPGLHTAQLLAQPWHLVLWFLAYVGGLAALSLPAATMMQVAVGWPKHTFSFNHVESTYATYQCPRCGHSSPSYFNPCPGCHTRFGGTSQHISEELRKQRAALERPYRDHPRNVYLPFVSLGLLVSLVIHGGGFLGQVVGFPWVTALASMALAITGIVLAKGRWTMGNKLKRVTFEHGRLAKVE